MKELSRFVTIAAAVAALAFAAARAEATSIIAIKTGDDIFIGADSKVLIENDIGISQCKITKMKDVYVVFTGMPALPASSFNAYTIAEKIFAGKGSIDKRMADFDQAVTGKLQEAFENLRTTNDKLFSRWYTEDVGTRIAMQILVAGAEKNGTTLVMLEYRITSQKNEPVKLKSIRQDVVTKKGSDQPKILFLGMQDAINALLKQKDFFSDFDEVRNINEWIMAEANAEPDRVSAPVDILKISPHKTQWIQHKKECPEVDAPTVKKAAGVKAKKTGSAKK